MTTLVGRLERDGLVRARAGPRRRARRARRPHRARPRRGWTRCREPAPRCSQAPRRAHRRRARGAGRRPARAGQADWKETDNEPQDQPKAVWAVAFACVIAFMGIGLVDPILPALAKDLHATPSQVVAAVHELLRVHRRLDARHRLRLQPDRRRARRCSPAWRSSSSFSALAGRVRHRRRDRRLPRRLGPGQRAVHRHRARGDHRRGQRRRVAARSSSTRPRSASASRPARCSAALLGGISWRGPFFGTAVLMAIGFVAISCCSKSPPSRRAGSRSPTRCGPCATAAC